MPAPDPDAGSPATRPRGRYWRDVLLQASGNTAAQALGILSMPLLTRLYSPADFAALNLFSQAVAMLTIVLTLRFEYLVMLPKDDDQSRAVVRRVVVLGCVMGAAWTLLLLSPPWAGEWLARQGDLQQWLWLAPATAWMTSVAVALQQRVQRSGDFRTSALSEFVSRCGYVASALAGALAQPSLIGLMSATLAGALAKVQVLRRRLRPARPVRPLQLEVPSGMTRLALSTSLSASIALAAGTVTLLMIADRFGASALGQYGLVVSTLYLPSTLLGQALGQVYYQRASALHAQARPFAPLLLQTSTRLALVGMPLFAVIAWAAPWAYPWVFGQAWREAGELARWLCLAAAVGFVSTPLDRTSLIVDAWWYQTAWHALRTLTALFTLLYAARQGLALNDTVAWLSVQTAAMYALDWACSWRMATRVPGRSASICAR